MADDFIDWGAYGLGVARVVQGWWIRLAGIWAMWSDGILRITTYFSLDTLSVHHLVDVVRCDSWFEFSCGCIEHFPSHSAHFSHALLLLFVQTSYSISCAEFVVGVAALSRSIIWMWYWCWNCPFLRERVYRSQGSGEGKGWERVVQSGCCIAISWDSGAPMVIRTARFMNGLMIWLESVSSVTGVCWICVPYEGTR